MNIVVSPGRPIDVDGIRARSVPRPVKSLRHFRNWFFSRTYCKSSIERRRCGSHFRAGDRLSLAEYFVSRTRMAFSRRKNGRCVCYFLAVEVRSAETIIRTKTNGTNNIANVAAEWRSAKTKWTNSIDGRPEIMDRGMTDNSPDVPPDLASFDIQESFGISQREPEIETTATCPLHRFHMNKSLAEITPPCIGLFKYFMAGARDGTLANFLRPTEVRKQLAFVPLVLDSWGIKMWGSHLWFSLIAPEDSSRRIRTHGSGIANFIPQINMQYVRGKYLPVSRHKKLIL